MLWAWSSELLPESPLCCAAFKYNAFNITYFTPIHPLVTVAHIRRHTCLPPCPGPSPTTSSPGVSDPEQPYFAPWYHLFIQPLHDSKCMVLTQLTSTWNSHQGHQVMWCRIKTTFIWTKALFSDLQGCCEWSSWAHTGLSLGTELSGPAFSSRPGHCPVLVSAPPLTHSLPNSSAPPNPQSNPPGPRTPVLPTVAHMNHKA